VKGFPTYWEAVGLKISARNRLKGEVLAVDKEGLIAKIKVEITVPTLDRLDFGRSS
jgi:molybdate transport system regulatory protein